MSVINATPLLAAAGGEYEISRSVRLRSSASAYFNRTPATTTSRTTWTWSAWVKRGALGGTMTLFGSSGANYDEFRIDGDKFRYFINGAVTADLMTSAVYRDPSAWYHIVLAVDTTQATSSNRIKMYVNGVQVTAFSTSTYPAQNTNGSINSNVSHSIGYSITNVALYVDGYLTDVNFIDGQALTPSSFGETDAVTGVWKPKKYAGTYGTNGFFLNFSNAASTTTIGYDYSGNGNNWTSNNISVTSGVTYDSMIDSPTMYADGGTGRGNYCTLNPLQPASTTVVVPTEGNLRMTGTASGNNVTGTMAIPMAAYFEGTVTTGGGTIQFGIRNLSTSNTYVYDSSGSRILAGSSSAYGASFTTNDVIGVAIDPVNLTLQFFKNGTSQGTITSAFPAGDYVPFFYASNTNASVANFGQRPFAYTPPTGFKALNTQNLPDATIKKGNAWFDATTYTGNGGTLAVTNSGGFQPDWIWVKSRNTAQNNYSIDSVRGINNILVQNNTEAESYYDATWRGLYGNVSAINSNGFTVVDGTDPTFDSFNGSTDTYVAWQWKESASAGFDIVTWTGNGSAQTISHSLGVAPAMIIMKNRTQGAAGYNWAVYHKSLSSASAFVDLNTTAGAGTNTGIWNATAPTSTVFSVGTARINNGDLNVAYLFAEVAGFSKFGSYTGNGSTDGPFVFCGFRPRFILYKNSSAASQWILYDTTRDTYNVANKYLESNTSDAENTSGAIDLLSNGFKIRTLGTDHNDSGNVYVYAAFAENPFKNSLAR